MLKANPGVRGILAEVAHVIEGARPKIATAGLADRGRERTAEEFAALFERSGFRLTKIVPMKSALSIVEAVRT